MYLLRALDSVSCFLETLLIFFFVVSGRLCSVLLFLLMLFYCDTTGNSRNG
jgi:hypothetical protein